MLRSMWRLSLSTSVTQHAKAVTISERAWTRVAEVNVAEKADRPLRMSIVPGGCQGFSYQFEFDSEPLDPSHDIVFENTSVKLSDGQTRAARIVLDNESIKKLQGAVIDYHSELKGAAFVVVGNELVDQACACAQSFSIKGGPK